MLTASELRSSTAKELSQELEKSRRELMKIRIGVRTQSEANTALKKKWRRYVALIQTIQREIELEEMVKNADKID